MKSKLLLIVLAVFFISIASVSAAPPVTTVQSVGSLFVEPIEAQWMQTGKLFTIHTHVFNTTQIITNKTTSCIIHLYNSTSDYEHIVNQNMAWDSTEAEWEYDSALYSFKTFELPGVYAYIVYCNTSTFQAGFSSGTLEVNRLGTEFTSTKMTVYALLLLIGLIIFGLFAFGAMALPWDNNRDEMTGYILAVSNKKYLKLACALGAYVTMMILLYFAEGLVNNLLYEMLFIGSLLHFLFLTMVVCVFPFFVIMIYLMIANWVKDNKLGEELAMGLRMR